MNNLTCTQLYTLRHMLGINTPNERTPRPYRNYAAVPPDDSEFIELEQLGVIEEYRAEDKGEYKWYRCTEAGQSVAMQSHKMIRRTKPMRRYVAFLNLHDALPDLTFKEFLTKPVYAKIRENA